MTGVQPNGWRRVVYREVNQRIREVSESFGADAAVEFLCECGADDCTATLEFSRIQYDALLGQDGCILVAAEHAHELPRHRVLAENGRFVVVASS